MSRRGTRLLAIVVLAGLALAGTAMLHPSPVVALTSSRESAARSVRHGFPELRLALRDMPLVAEKGKEDLKLPPDLFNEWVKPELALVVSGQQHGYLLPCGCSRPQVGGLERRYNFLQLLRDRGWAVAAVDVGDIPQRQGPRQLSNVQGLIKYRYSMESLKKMDYLAVGLGEYEANLSLFTLLGEYALNNERPAVLAANLHDRDNLYPGQVKSHVVEQPKGSKLKLGVAGLVGPSVGAKLQAFKVKLGDNRVEVPRLLKELATAKTDLNVLLYQGTLKEAKALAEAHKQFQIVVCLCAEDEPSSEPARVGDSLVVTTGHKGRYVGVVGVFPTGKVEKPYEFRYQLVSLGEEFLTPEADRAKQPILQLMDDYARELKAQDYLSKYPGVKHPAQVEFAGLKPTFAGSDKCKKCHESAYEIWKDSKHAHAYQTLVDVKQPAFRHHDAECIVCHTVGFGYDSGFKNEKETLFLKDVGCESCHGPGSEHIKKPKDDRWYPVLNPWRGKKDETATDKEARMLRIDQFCQKCHDIDNDVKYKFEKRWPPVEH